MQNHKISNKGLQFIASKEGLCQTKYLDSVGVWTIAIGATRSEIPDLASWPIDKKLTIKECIDLFKRSIKKYEEAVNKYLTRTVKQHEFDALVSWCYNVGPGWLKKATVIRRINRGESGKRLYDALMMYRKPPEIIGRRRAEARLLAYGQYPKKMLVNVFPVSRMGRPIYSRGKPLDLTLYLIGDKQVEPKNPVPNNPLPETEKSKPGESTWERILRWLLDILF